eukprot:1755100-Prymnesium_polylepis.1
MFDVWLSPPSHKAARLRCAPNGSCVGVLTVWPNSSPGRGGVRSPLAKASGPPDMLGLVGLMSGRHGSRFPLTRAGSFQQLSDSVGVRLDGKCPRSIIHQAISPSMKPTCHVPSAS